MESPESICAKIDAVTPQDLQRVAAKFLESKPSVASFGDVNVSVPKVEDVQFIIDKYENKIRKS
jgi:hypothetical protein